MDREPISFREKVEARYTRRGTGPCWMWEGSLWNGRPSLNLRYVARYIYEWERGPIPPGFVLWRADHTPTCFRQEDCRHRQCVNPYHFRLMPGNGTYQRKNAWGGTTTEHINHYAKQRAKGPSRKGKKNDDDGDSQGVDAPRRDHRVEGLRVAESPVGEPRDPGDSDGVREAP